MSRRTTSLMPLIVLLLVFLGLEQIFAAPAAQPDTKTLYMVPCRTNSSGNWAKVRTARSLKSDQELLTLLSTRGVNHRGHVGKIDLSINPADIGASDTLRSYGVCESKDILAARDGAIAQIGFTNDNGNYIVIRHDDGQETWYAHMASLARLRRGDRVRMGDVIGIMGDTGNAIGVHLHFSVDNTPVGTWKFVKDVYQISSVPTGLALDVSGASRDNGAAVVQWPWGGGSNQKWVLEPAGEDYFYVRSLHSSKCLDVSEGAGHNGANIIQYTCRGTPNQQWRLSATGATTTLQVRHSGKVIDAPSSKKGVTLVQWDAHGGANQQWLVRPAN